jgi:hypothetical protein
VALDTNNGVRRVPGGWLASTGHAIAARIGYSVLEVVGLQDLELARAAVQDAFSRTVGFLPEVRPPGHRDQTPMFFAIREGEGGPTAHAFHADGRPGIPLLGEDGEEWENTLMHWTYPDNMSAEASDAWSQRIYGAETFDETVRTIAGFFQAAREVGIVGPDLHLATLEHTSPGTWERRFAAVPLAEILSGDSGALSWGSAPPTAPSSMLGRKIQYRATSVMRRAGIQLGA